MKKLSAAVASLLSASTALAAGDSGTSGMGEMNVTGAQFAMMVGGLVGLGIVIWVVAKIANRGSSKPQ